MHGNVSEWVQDCVNKNYNGAPTDGSAWQSGDCSMRMKRGGAWYLGPDNKRSANRHWGAPGVRTLSTGFRLVQDR